MFEYDPVNVSGKRLPYVPQISAPIDYSQFLPGWLKENPRWVDLFNCYGALFSKNLQPAIDELALIRNPSIQDDQMLLNNAAMLGFKVPVTGLTDQEGYLVNKYLGTFLITRNASYSFLDFLSFIKNVKFTAKPLFAASITTPVSQLVYLEDINQELDEHQNPILDASGNPLTLGQTSGTTIIENPVTDNDDDNYTDETNTQVSDENDKYSYSINGGFFPTTFYDVEYSSSDFNVDESLIQYFILLLQPMHLVFRQFVIYNDTEIDIDVPVIAQVMSYIGTLVGNSVNIIPSIYVDTGGDIVD